MVRVYLVACVLCLGTELAKADTSKECGVKIDCAKAIETVENFTKFMKGDRDQDPYEQCETFQDMGVDVPSCCQVQNNCGY